MWRSHHEGETQSPVGMLPEPGHCAGRVGFQIEGGVCGSVLSGAGLDSSFSKAEQVALGA